MLSGRSSHGGYLLSGASAAWLAAGATAWFLWGIWAALVVLATLAFAFGDLVIAAWVNRRVDTSAGAEAYVGRTGTVFDTRSMGEDHWHGRIRVHGELWNAYAEGDRPDPGDQVNVTEVDGLKLRVVRAPSHAKE